MKSIKVIIFILVISLLAVNYLIADQKIYEKKCSKCHSLRNPDKYSKTEWKYNVERMSQRAGLSEDEIKSIIELNLKK